MRTRLALIIHSAQKGNKNGDLVMKVVTHIKMDCRSKFQIQLATYKYYIIWDMNCLCTRGSKTLTREVERNYNSAFNFDSELHFIMVILSLNLL